MKSIFVILMVFLILTACSRWKQNNVSNLIESQWQLVVGCEKLGLVSQTADAGHPVSALATRKMIRKIKKQALELGGTHIVWRHRTQAAAAAEVYRCPSGQ